jgi:hypothetical protein
MKIAIETETAADSSMFRVLLGDRLIGEGLTAAQARLLAAEVIECLVLPRDLELRLGPRAEERTSLHRGE